MAVVMLREIGSSYREVAAALRDTAVIRQFASPGDTTMRQPLLLASLLLLGACASPLPAADPSMAWIDLKGEGIDLLMAERLDRERVNDGRYFQVTPGAHELEMRYRFEIAGGGGVSMISEPQELTCDVRIRYDDFKAGQRYRVEARSAAMRAYTVLYDADRNVLARGKNLRCGTF